MRRLLHRHRKFAIAAVLGLWQFALFAGIANACGWDDVTAHPHPSALTAHAVTDATDHGDTPGCDEFCSNDVPMPSVQKLVLDQAAGQAVVVATHHDLGVLPNSAHVLRLARTAHPSPGVPFFLRIVRLTL